MIWILLDEAMQNFQTRYESPQGFLLGEKIGIFVRKNLGIKATIQEVEHHGTCKERGGDHWSELSEIYPFILSHVVGWWANKWHGQTQKLQIDELVSKTLQYGLKYCCI